MAGKAGNGQEWAGMGGNKLKRRIDHWCLIMVYILIIMKHILIIRMFTLVIMMHILVIMVYIPVIMVNVLSG